MRRLPIRLAICYNKSIIFLITTLSEISMQINYNRRQKSDIVISKPSASEVGKYLKT